MHHGGASQGVKGQGVKLAIFALGKEKHISAYDPQVSISHGSYLTSACDCE